MTMQQNELKCKQKVPSLNSRDMDKRNEEENTERKLTARYVHHITFSTSKTPPGEQLYTARLPTGARGQRCMHQMDVEEHPPYT